MLKKSNYSTFIDTVNEITTIGRNRNIGHLYTSDQDYNGRNITIPGRPDSLIHFGSCSYLGLELDQRLKDASKDAIQRYGAQFSCSRTYVSATPYKELENKLEDIFRAPVILNVNSTSAHSSVIPIIMESGDAVIFDQQAHISMQEMKYKLLFNGVYVDFLRHSRVDELKVKIEDLSLKYNKIWYCLDGVYSMFGDLAPIHELMELLKQNEKLHLYIDDAHSMSIFGEKGEGYILSQVEQNLRMVLTVSLAKGFGSAGGVTIFKDEEMYWRVKSWGGCLTFSGPQQPAVIAASTASAKIHLTPEINDFQKELQDKVTFCNELIKKYDLPVVSESITPIFFIGLGITKVGYNMVERLMSDGLFVNLGIYPAVSERNTGIRFTITRHHLKEDIERLIERIAFHLPLALQEEGRSMEDIYKAFRSIKKKKYLTNSPENSTINNNPKFKIQKEKTIKNISQKDWDDMFKEVGTFDWNGLSMLEEAFKNNILQEDNWDFHYYILRDSFNKPVLATLLTSLLTKDDMLAPDAVSKEVEARRLTDNYYLTSKSLMMGSLLTEGNHLYIDKTNPEWKNALKFLIDLIWEEQEKLNINTVFLRDFDEDDIEIKDFMMDNGFVKIKMPSSNIVDLSWQNREEYITQLSRKNRKHLRQNVLEYEDSFEIEIIENANDEQVEKWYELYDNVRRKNLLINNFKLPTKLFRLMASSPYWECIQFSIFDKDEGKQIPIGIIFAYKNGNYSNSIVGLDYRFLQDYKTYRQTLFQTILRGIDLKAKRVYFGLTADFEKKKVGAVTVARVAYVQSKDSFNSHLLSLIPQKEFVS